jgi:hypothetical protein
MLAKDVVIENGLQISNEDAVASILWEISFWGYTPKQIDETFQNKNLGKSEEADEETDNPYRCAANKLSQKQSDNELPKRYRGCRTIPWRYAFKNIRMNRSKRKRKFRQDKRIDYLEKMAKRLDLFNEIASTYSIENTEKLKERIFAAPYMLRYDYGSHTTPGNEVMYVYELLTKYNRNDFSEYDETLLLVTASEEIIQLAGDSLAGLICPLFPNPQLIVKSDDAVKELELFVLLFKTKK